MVYPEPEKGGRGKNVESRKAAESAGFGSTRLKQARAVSDRERLRERPAAVENFFDPFRRPLADGAGARRSRVCTSVKMIEDGNKSVRMPWLLHHSRTPWRRRRSRNAGNGPRTARGHCLISNRRLMVARLGPPPPGRTMPPLSLSTEEMDLLLALAAPIDHQRRPEFLAAVAQELEARGQPATEPFSLNRSSAKIKPTPIRSRDAKASPVSSGARPQPTEAGANSAEARIARGKAKSATQPIRSPTKAPKQEVAANEPIAPPLERKSRRGAQMIAAKWTKRKKQKARYS